MGRKSLAQKQQEALEDEELKNYKPKIEKQANFVAMFCGFIIFIIGLYLTVNKNYILGQTLAGRFSKGGATMVLYGPGILIMGLVIFAVPVYYIIRQNSNNYKK